jgi:glycosyltransferase involved in cell wall biosynthesis
MLRILFVAHGNMPIPPTGWGAVESLIWDYSVHLKKLGHSVDILNIHIEQVDHILDHIHNNKYDVVHLHNDILVNILHLMPKALPVVVSSHYPYIHDPTQWADPVSGYDYGKYVMTPLLKAVEQRRIHIVAISQKDRDAFVSYGVPRESVSVCVNGMDTSKFVLGQVVNPGSMICLAQIIPRKRQHLFKGLDFIKCVGALNDESALPSQGQYLGEWTTDEKYQRLTQYSGGILLSDGENGTPLSVKESLAAGLGLVVSEAVASEIPTTWPWVTVIPESKSGDQAYLREACQKIMEIAGPLKAHIRAEAAALWDWSVLVPKYAEVLERVIVSFR